MSLRFHWMLPKGGEVDVDGRQTAQEANRYRIEAPSGSSPAPRPDLPGWLHFARHAEDAGIESVLISFSRYEPDPVTVSCALGQAARKLKFMLAFRSGLMQPATFVQQINTLSLLLEGRLSLNIVAGSSAAEQRGYGDFLSHDDRYARAEEFLAVCDAFWRNGSAVDFDGRFFRVEGGKLLTPFVAPGRASPEIYVSGHSEASERLAITRGTSWLRVVDTPESLAPAVARVRAHGTGVCLRLCVLCRATHGEAVDAIESLLRDDEVSRRQRLAALKDDSQMHKEAAAAMSATSSPWLSRSLFTGFVPYHGPVWTTLAGSPDELADAFLAYKKIGVTEFILSGWPEVGEVDIFGSEVLPRIRREESHGAVITGNGGEGTVTAEAPSAFNREMYVDHPENVFYGTDDGAQDGSFSEFAEIQAHFEGVAPDRRKNIHMISVVGGLYGLNLIPLWRPERLTIFDINPAALTYFRIIRDVFITSRNAAHFLARLTAGDYDTSTDLERFVQENISMKQKGCLPRERGSTKRPYEQSWQYAFEHFDVTKRILAEAPLEIRNEPMESESFRKWIRRQDNLWVYASNITEFHYFDLEFDNPRNVVMVQIIFPAETQILDLAPLAGGPVRVDCEIPLRASRIDHEGSLADGQ
jgi:alkanesulfonate monooxygenase